MGRDLEVGRQRDFASAGEDARRRLADGFGRLGQSVPGARPAAAGRGGRGGSAGHTARGAGDFWRVEGMGKLIVLGSSYAIPDETHDNTHLVLVGRAGLV